MKYSVGKKVAAYIGAILLTVIWAFCVLGFIEVYSRNDFAVSKEGMIEEEQKDLAEDLSMELFDIIMNMQSKEAAVYRLIGTNVTKAVIELDGKDIWYWSGEESRDTPLQFVTVIYQVGDSYYSYQYGIPAKVEENGEVKQYLVGIEVAQPYFVRDQFSNAARTMAAIYSFRYVFPIAGVASAILVIILLVYLIRASGRHGDDGVVTPAWDTAFPFDIHTIIFFGASILLLVIAFSVGLGVFGVVIAILCCIAIEAMFIHWVMDLALKVKLKKLISSLAIRKGFLELGKLIENKTVAVKSAICFVIIAAVEGVFIMYNRFEGDNIFCFWLVEKILLCILIGKLVTDMKVIKVGAEKMAAGDFTAKTDTTKMYFDIKEHAETLNSIGDAAAKAAADSIKSERMRTELITNVSHDIKTPLTSIINYSDLIGREKSENPKIEEYAEVLYRQSVRLKRLLEDLVEASKASSGNVKVDMSFCEADIFITQTAGEYGEKLEEAGLELICTVPEEKTVIKADGRHMMRIFDNLMNNICKYSLPGSRVYLSLLRQDGRAVFGFRNISKEPLNITAEELKERFVRGDSSRNTEGSGLGLSIAESLAVLMDGKLELSIDGDLFKVSISFPCV